MVVSSSCAKVQHWWTSRVHMQQDAIDGVHFPSTGLVRLDECELPIAIQPNAPEQVRDGRQRVDGPLIIFVIDVLANSKRGLRKGIRCQGPNVHVARPSRTEARKVARPYRDTDSSIIFRCTVQRRSSARVARVPVARCSVVRVWVACQAAQAGVAAAGICRGEGGLQHHRLALLGTPSERKTYPGWLIYTCTLSVFSPTNLSGVYMRSYPR